MKHALSRLPVLSFSLPPFPPAGVADPAARFEALGDRYGALRGDIQDAREAAVQARSDAKAAAVAAYRAGKKPPDVAAVEADHKARVEALEQQVEALAGAVDEAGSEMARAIGEHRGEWLASLGPAAEDAAERFQTAIEAAQAALDEYRTARGAVDWLQGFDVRDAVAGEQQQFPGGSVKVDASRIRKNDQMVDPALLLEVALTVTEPAPDRRPRTHMVAAA